MKLLLATCGQSVAKTIIVDAGDLGESQVGKHHNCPHCLCVQCLHVVIVFIGKEIGQEANCSPARLPLPTFRAEMGTSRAFTVRCIAMIKRADRLCPAPEPT